MFNEFKWEVVVQYRWNFWPSPFKLSFHNTVDGRDLIMYNNTPSKAIVNVASNITYRPLIGADDTGRCTLIIWPDFGTRLISFSWSFKWENYLKWFSNKTVTIFLDRQQKNGLNFFSTTLLLYKLDTLLLKQKKLPVLDITAFTWVLMRKKKPVISNTGRFFCFNSTHCILYITYI